ncbi:isoprenoid synthase domain-containing protein [Suillus clintonianus]|uniref:isoprenoid synthase domain-containing protein n=1 Tax=Suillus clintonianus TaxID=1904413 RepID=UPI001B87DB01|nr:isoprenoid synthase domain-containing protein [Suillus clintonianus]KAG2147667.1 isoprenoid synthase domain-containing protein [Suillus clintonianus]
MSSAAIQYTLPDLLSLCSFDFSKPNPYLQECSAESNAWVTRFNVLNDKNKIKMENSQSELLCALVYPYAGHEGFRTTCDFVNLLFVLDHLSDDMNGKDAHGACEVFYQVMADPDFNHESILAKITLDFRQSILRAAKPQFFKHFLSCLRGYTQAVVQEAELREAGEVHDLINFVPLRRENSAVRCCFTFIEYNLDIELPDAVFDDPIFQSVYFAAVDMVCWSNDLFSYNVEQAMGHTSNNIVTVLMQEKGMSVQEAVDSIGVVFKQLMTRFLKDKSRLPSWGADVDRDVALYVEGLTRWVGGNLVWSFQCSRYFGTANNVALLTRLVTLYPKDTEVEQE